VRIRAPAGVSWNEWRRRKKKRKKEKGERCVNYFV
jgi:hypothetical protein